MFKVGDVGFSFDGLAKWVGFLGGILAFTLGVLQLGAALRPPQHELSVQVPQVELFGSDIRLSFVFHNTGNYDEIMTNIGLYLVENLGVHGKEDNIEITEYDKMIPIASSKTCFEILEGRFDLNSKPITMMIEKDKVYSLVTRYSIASENGGFVTATMPIGSVKISRNGSGEYYGDMALVSNRRMVDFGKAKPVVTITNIPRTTEYDLPKLEVVQ